MRTFLVGRLRHGLPEPEPGRYAKTPWAAAARYHRLTQGSWSPGEDLRLFVADDGAIEICDPPPPVSAEILLHFAEAAAPSFIAGESWLRAVRVLDYREASPFLGASQPPAAQSACLLWPDPRRAVEAAYDAAARLLAHQRCIPEPHASIVRTRLGHGGPRSAAQVGALDLLWKFGFPDLFPAGEFPLLSALPGKMLSGTVPLGWVLGDKAAVLAVYESRMGT